MYGEKISIKNISEDSCKEMGIILEKIAKSKVLQSYAQAIQIVCCYDCKNGCNTCLIMQEDKRFYLYDDKVIGELYECNNNCKYREKQIEDKEAV